MQGKRHRRRTCRRSSGHTPNRIVGLSPAGSRWIAARYFFCKATTLRVCNCSIAATTVWAMFVFLSPVMNYSHMDALLASDSKRQFDLDGMSPATLERRSETHILRLN